MTLDLRQAFSALRYEWSVHPNDLWRKSPIHVDGLHPRAMQAIDLGIADAVSCIDTSPLGVAIRGSRGTGKTHLMGWIRERTQLAGGYFVLVGPVSGVNVWKTVASAFRRDLGRTGSYPGTQLEQFLERLANEIDLDAKTRDALLGDGPLTVAHLDDLVGALRRHDRLLASECQDTLRALVLYNSADRALEDIGKSYLLSDPELEAGERAAWRIRAAERAPHDIVRDITGLLAVTGPTVIAFDQIDGIESDTGDGDNDTSRHDSTLAQIADTLVLLRDITARTLTVLSCLPATWILLENITTLPPVDRFRTPVDITSVGAPDLAAQIISQRFGPLLERVGVDRPYPTWPVRERAFTRLAQLSPRRLLQRIDNHVEHCLNTSDFREIDGVDDQDSFITVPIGAPPGPTDADLEQALTELDRRFRAERGSAKVSAALEADTENKAMPPLLRAALQTWIQEQGSETDAYDLDPAPGPRPDLHARLTRVLNETTGAEITWSFRAIASTVPITALNRLRAACEESAIDDGTGRRHLFILRNQRFNDSKKTQETVEAFKGAGGRQLDVNEADLQAFAALQALLDEPPPFLQEWLQSRRPASNTALLQQCLGPDGGSSAALSPPGPRGQSGSTQPSTSGSDNDLVAGRDPEDGAPTTIPLQTLSRHAVIFAGSGSGKTVLIRRLIEEAALRGVSSIVFDVNNDLARLGEAWPQAPEEWQPEDARLAARYLNDTEVVIWTPRRSSGRPLTFQPLPDFATVVGEPDELDAAIDVATAALAARISMGAANRARVAEAVLREALQHYARSGGTSDLTAFLDLLADLPAGVTDLDPRGKVSTELAQALKAAVINDPLFGGRGQAADPGILLTPTAGKRARVSVISLIGLTSDDQKQSFVNQLQMALFSWIKQHPANDRPLSGLLIMDEAQNFAPATGSTLCKASTLALVAQARKYGLGMVFATQHPRGLDNRIPGNAATQFIGRLNAPVQIATVQELARARGGDASEVGRLPVGMFYLTADDVAFRKLRTPLCLSFHGRPLTEEEVLEAAQ